MVFAMTSPRPEALMMPRMVAVNAMNGRMLRMTISMDSRPAWKNFPTTLPTPMPILVMMPGSFCSRMAATSALA